MVGCDVVAVVVDRGPPSFLGVDVIDTGDQTGLMNLPREAHVSGVHIVEDDVGLRRDIAGVRHGGRKESHPFGCCTVSRVRAQILPSPGDHEEELPPQLLQGRPALGRHRRLK